MTQGIEAVLIDVMGTDLSVANAARVTMGVEHQELNDNDTRLIKFLAKHHHVTPFRHPTASFRCKAPIAIARQLGKHQVGFSWNEMSRRYKDGEVETFVPDIIFKRPADLHQGAGERFAKDFEAELKESFELHYKHCVKVYELMLEDGMAPEQARFVLPQGMVTEWVWTGSLFGWSELCRQRLSNHAQYEVRLFAQQIDAAMAERFPIAWAALRATHEHQD